MTPQVIFNKDRANALTKQAECDELQQMITNAATGKMFYCEVEKLTINQEAWLKDRGFVVKKTELMGGAKIQIIWE